jgi:ATP-dependent RNA helicase RhlE
MPNTKSTVTPERAPKSEYRNYGTNKPYNRDQARPRFSGNNNNRFEERRPDAQPSGPRIVATEFVALGISEDFAARLGGQQIMNPTPIQEMAIPVVLSKKDLIGIAQTGTGKTLAFGLPMLMNLKGQDQGLVLAPTRELAMQIEETFRKLGVRTALLIGGAPMNRQIQQLRSNPRVIVATPGRMQDHMNQRLIDLRYIQCVVLDEADRMLDMGFITAIREILSKTPKTRQTLLFSATFPRIVEDIAEDFMIDPERVQIKQERLTASTVTQELIVIDKESKAEMLTQLLYANKGTILVFSRTRHGARKIAQSINRQGHTAAEIHSDRTLAQRIAALNGFKSGQYRILVATDIAARGIDVKDISLVINYDIPECADDYVHRIGRTGRAGKTGHAITMVAPDQHRDVRDIEKLISMKFETSTHSTHSLPEFQRHQNAGGKPRRFAPGQNRGGKSFGNGGGGNNRGGNSGARW